MTRRRAQGVSNTPVLSPLRRSSRLLAAQAIVDVPELSQPNHSSKKRKHDSYNETTPALNTAKKQRLNPIEHWRRQGNWPKELFESGITPTLSGFVDSFAVKSLDYKRSIGCSTISARDLNKDERAAPYQHPRYEQTLQLKGFYMSEDDRGPTKKSIETYKKLFKKHVTLPQNTGFAGDLFEQTIKDIHAKNEARIIRDIGLLICPSPEDLSKRKAIKTRHLCESINEAWDLAQPITPNLPQPDFSVGFTREAFTEEQLDKLRDVLGNSDDQASFLHATWYMYFPFLGCEAGRGGGDLDVEDRQNAHSMGIAVRAVVILFHLAGRAEEVDGHILAFSVSYNDSSVRIYGYYPRIKGTNVTYHRHRIADICLLESASTEPRTIKERWKTYKFISSIYEHWAPAHLKRLQAILAKIPHRAVFMTGKGSGLTQDFSCSSASGEPTTNGVSNAK